MGGKFGSESFRPFFISRCGVDKCLGSEDPSYIYANAFTAGSEGIHRSFTNSMPRLSIQVAGCVDSVAKARHA